MKEKIYQIFNQWGEDVGILTGINKADVVKKARELICEFPILVEIKKEK